MKNKLILSILLIICMLGSTAGVFAAGGSPAIAESPELKFVIDGVFASYKYVPISISQRTLLPYAELLPSLGVANDAEHIVYNPSEQSLTVYKDTVKLYLKVGSKTAVVNDKPVLMDVAPVIYAKNRQVYIPLRFTAETLGEKVIWDGTSDSILLRDVDEYNKIRDILDKSNTAMDAAKKYTMAMDVDASVKVNQVSMDMGVSVTGEIDIAKKAMHMEMAMDIFGMNMNSDTYYIDNASYTLNPFTDKWEKKTYTAMEYDAEFKSQDFDLLEINEALYAGLVVSQGTNSDETVLKGDVYLKELFDKAMSGQSVASDGKPEVDKYYLEIVLDSKTNLPKSMKLTMSGVVQEEDGKSSISMELNVVYGDYDGSFEIIVPDEVINNAEETSEENGNNVFF